MKATDSLAARARTIVLEAGATRAQADQFSGELVAAVAATRARLARVDRELRRSASRRDSRGTHEFIDGAVELVQPGKGKLRQLGLHARKMLEILDDLSPWPAAIALAAACRDSITDQLDIETQAAERRARIRKQLEPLAAWEDPGRIEIVWGGRAAERRQLELDLVRAVARAWQAALGEVPEARGPFLAAARAAIEVAGNDTGYHAARRLVALALRSA